MNDGLRFRLGAVALALLTLAAMVFAVLNFQQRSRFVVPDDGVTWMDSAQRRHGLARCSRYRLAIEPESSRAITSNPSVEPRSTAPRTSPDCSGAPAPGRKSATKSGATASRSKCRWLPRRRITPSSIENYLRITALLYLFIGLFIFVRRWNAPRAIHFYVFCLVSFVLYSFHYSGKLNSFDWTIYWGNVVALLLQPALLVHFALVFPERRGSLWPKLAGCLQRPRRPARAAPLRGHGDARFLARRSAAANFSTRLNCSIWVSISWSPRAFSWPAISARPAECCGSN